MGLVRVCSAVLMELLVNELERVQKKVIMAWFNVRYQKLNLKPLEYADGVPSACL
jgi:hypothetical protein